MKVSKRTRKAMRTNIDKPHIRLLKGWWTTHSSFTDYDIEAAKFCKKLNKALTEE